MTTTPDLRGWSRVAREAVGTTYPWAPGHLVLGPDDTRVVPEELHPAFHGSLDWHSCVHMLWSLTRLVEGYADQLGAAETRAAVELLGERLSPEKVAAEVAYLRERPGFERPYGWAWAAQLGASCALSGRPEARGWAAATGPLLDAVAGLVLAWLPRQTYPVRHGKHQNDAFALTLLIDAYGRLGREDVVAACRDRALEWFGGDEEAPTAWEPGGTDFLSPALTEAVLMRRVLAPEELAAWLGRFLPGLGEGEPQDRAVEGSVPQERGDPLLPGGHQVTTVTGDRHGHLLQAPEVGDTTDGQYAHLLGLALSRAWQLRELAAVLEGDDHGAGVAGRLRAGADRQEAAVVGAITAGDFMATHWLVSFGLLARGELG